jgi:hypothetical protein
MAACGGCHARPPGFSTVRLIVLTAECFRCLAISLPDHPTAAARNTSAASNAPRCPTTAAETCCAYAMASVMEAPPSRATR